MIDEKVIISFCNTEKSALLSSLKDRNSNRSISRFEKDKRVFFVDVKASKPEISQAVENLFSGVKVDKVNTVRLKGKMKRSRNGKKKGMTREKKKAIITLKKGSVFDV